MLDKLKKNATTMILVFILTIGLLLLVYPTVSDYWNSLHQSEAVAAYVKNVANLTGEENKLALEEAQQYNQDLEREVIPDLNVSVADLDTYNQVLDPTQTGIMAYVEIPKLQSSMPIYHGTDDAILQVAIGHIPGTSLPVGGEGTHAVISGHRGLPSAKLFSDIDQLVAGDIFYIQVLDETLTYEVDQILTVTPDDVSPLAIEDNQDYVTLVTCTPYGVNSHRLLVRGHRIENQAITTRITSEASQVKPILVVPFMTIILLMLLFLSAKVYGLAKFMSYK